MVLANFNTFIVCLNLYTCILYIEHKLRVLAKET